MRYLFTVQVPFEAEDDASAREYTAEIIEELNLLEVTLTHKYKLQCLRNNEAPRAIKLPEEKKI